MVAALENSTLRAMIAIAVACQPAALHHYQNHYISGGSNLFYEVHINVLDSVMRSAFAWGSV